MKYKIISAVVATALLSGCDEDNDNTLTPTPTPILTSIVQAYDPAVANMDAKYACEDGTTGYAGVTDGYGNVKVANDSFALNPENCDVTFEARDNSVDMSNNKSMAGVVYNIPRGMAIKGQKVTGSPLSTLLANTLAGSPYTEAAASKLLVDLDLDDLVNNGASLSELFLNPEVAAEKLTPAEKSQFLATTAIVSDVVKNADEGAKANELTAAAEAITVATLAEYPLYPSSSKTDPDAQPIYLEIPAALITKTVENPSIPVNINELPDPVDAEEPTNPPTGGTGPGTPTPTPTPDPTGGTGGTGGSGDDGTGS